MKKCLLVSVLLALCAYTIAQQKNGQVSTSATPIKLKKEPRFYLNVHGGYSYGLGSTFKFYPDNITSIDVTQIDGNSQVKKANYSEGSKGLGEGFRAGIGFSYILNDFVNIGLDIDYSRSTISKVKDSSFYSLQNSNGQMNELIYKGNLKISYQATLITFSPNIIFKAISKPKFFIYNKIGAVLVFRPNSIQRETQSGNYRMGWQGFFRDSAANLEKRYDWGLKNPAIGFMGGIGAQRKIKEKIRVFAELQFTHLVFKVRNRILTSYTVQGKEMVNSLPRSAREIIFKKEYVSSDVSNDPNQPAVATYERFPITYMGVQAGIAYRF